MNDQQVREQYEEYPYPDRDPENEKNSVLITGGEFLEEINHWLFRGKESFERPFRILVAGGGTGDASTFLGEQLKNRPNAAIVYLDFSEASLEIARQRAQNRGIQNIHWIHGNLLDLPKLNLGRFDYISCTGVLHHLASPLDGLKILADSLSDGGGMLLMLFGRIGRTGVYQMQELLRLINQDVLSKSQEIEIGRQILDELPASNWFSRGIELTQGYDSDAGFYDLFLHKQDRAFTIPEVYDLLDTAGLNLVEFALPIDRRALKIRTHITNPSLIEKIEQMDSIRQQTICELLSGTMIRHAFYVSKEQGPSARLDDLDNVPYFFVPSAIPRQVLAKMRQNSVNPGDNLKLILKNDSIQEVPIELPVSIYTQSILNQMLKETKTLRQIFKGVRWELRQEIPDETLIAEIRSLFGPFISLGVLLLRDQSVWPRYARPRWNSTQVI